MPLKKDCGNIHDVLTHPLLHGFFVSASINKG